MAGTIIFATICAGGVAFLLHVFVALCRERSPRYNPRKSTRSQSKVVVQLPTEAVFTADSIRPVWVPEDAAFAIVTESSRTSAAFYIDEHTPESKTEETWQLFPKAIKIRAKGAR